MLCYVTSSTHIPPPPLTLCYLLHTHPLINIVKSCYVPPSIYCAPLSCTSASPALPTEPGPFPASLALLVVPAADDEDGDAAAATPLLLLPESTAPAETHAVDKK
jgi:hypothetical protein